MFRVWYSSESFADYIIAHTQLRDLPTQKKKLIASDASDGSFHTMPDHLRKILYLDCPDIIVEKDGEPIFTIEESKEAGTGHNVFQRFARLAASVENKVPAFFIYPQAKLIYRESNDSIRWDAINPLIFKAMEDMMSIYEIPALLFYFPSRYGYREATRITGDKGLIYDEEFPSCPCSQATSMQSLFGIINEVLRMLAAYEPKNYLQKLLFRNQRAWMQSQYVQLLGDGEPNKMSPLSSVTIIPTEVFIKYLSKRETSDYKLGEFLKSRRTTAIYQVNAKFRGDPYPGALAAIDYMICREGQTYEDRKQNLVILFGELDYNRHLGRMSIRPSDKCKITSFFDDVAKCKGHNLLTREYKSLKSSEIPRYMMQVRYGSTYSKSKHIRVYSYFADAILFPDGELWRDA